MTKQSYIDNLRKFVSLLVKARVRTSADWKKWRKVAANETTMEELFEYTRLDGMPSVTAVVKPFFHPKLPLVGLNYTQVAHNVLHQYPSGWTQPLRLCRGIVFSRRGKLVALPFPKFFNDEEMEETRNLPNMPFVATLKHDGHLGIIFEYQGQIIVTTRGSFKSRSSVLANEMIPTVGPNWASTFPKNTTVLVEIIHPNTKVIVDYEDSETFILIGAYNRNTGKDLDYSKLQKLAGKLEIEVTETWSGDSIEDLRTLMDGKRYINSEGYVVRFQNGFRVKMKHAGYIGEMIKGKLTHRYVMQRLMTDTFDSRFSDLAGEIQAQANRLKKAVMAVTEVDGNQKARWAYLYGLFEEEDRTAYTKGICRQFERWLMAQSG